MVEHLDALQAALADRYAVERELGRGGMATVYLAHDLKHNRPVAIKVLRSELGSSLGAGRFLDEIEITANLHHPNILPLHDSGEADGRLFFVMPYVEGESLEDRLAREGPIEAGEAVTIAREVADALAYAHEHGVVHRDIKPGNLLLVAGHAVVADFGIARAVTAAGADGPSGTGAIVGSPAYMSPEQVRQGEVDGRADIYALGCVLYEMLTGEIPYPAEGLAVLAGHLHEEVPSAREKRAEVWEELDLAIARAMAKSPGDRHASAAEFGEALKAAARSEALRRHGTLPATLITYGAGGWLLYRGIAWGTTEFFMPDWVRVGALGLLLIGLPVFLATALLQRRVRLRRTRAHRLFSWRNAFAGGLAGFVTLGLGAGGFVASRALGIGPAASLVAQGLLEGRDPLILADFDGTDSVLARTATEALRIDLAGSEAVTLIAPRALRGVLERMQLDPGKRLAPSVASEAAVREGVKGVIAGEVDAAGSGFLLTLRLVSPADGTPLVSDRETAADPDQFIGAIDNLSRRLRSRLGESVRSIRSSPPLARRTTPSLEALKRHTAGYRAEIAGDFSAALALYEDAVRIDTAFAAAHLKIGIMLANRAEDRGRMIRSVTKAYELRQALGEVEQIRAELLYYGIVTGDLEQAAASGERFADLAGSPCFNNNLAYQYLAMGDLGRAEATLRPMVEECPIRDVSPSINLAGLMVRRGRFEEARATLDGLAEVFPRHPSLHQARAELAAGERRLGIAARHYRALALIDQSARVTATRALAYLATTQGRLQDARSGFEAVLVMQDWRGRGGDYLTEVARLAGLEALVAEEPSEALELIADALRAHPLELLSPHDRPYLALADLYAAAGRPREARSLLAEYEAEVRPKHLGREIERLRVQSQAALTDDDPTAALAALEGMEAIPNVECRPLCTLPLIGRAYEMLGRPDSAVAAYERYVSTPAANRHEWDPLYLAFVYERLGALHEERDDFESAMKYYAMFVELWIGADDVLQPRVRAAQARLQEIVEKRG